MINLSETEKAYLAGFFDGEGCVSISHAIRKRQSITPVYHLTISFTQSGQRGFEMLKSWQIKTGLGVVSKRKHYNPKHKDGYNWTIATNKATVLLNALIPYLVLKRAEAELAITFQNAKKKSPYSGKGILPKTVIKLREETYQEMHRLKHDNPAPIHLGPADLKELAGIREEKQETLF